MDPNELKKSARIYLAVSLSAMNCSAIKDGDIDYAECRWEKVHFTIDALIQRYF